MGTVETTEEINMDSKIAMEYLVSGYINNNFIKSSNYNYPLSLNDMILSYVGNLFLRFDAIHKDYQYIIENNGINIKYDGKNKVCLVGSSFCLNKRINSFRIKIIDTGKDAIGIISDINECFRKEIWFNQISCNGYMWYYSKYRGSGKICIQSSHKLPFDLDQQNVPKSDKWLPGDIITVKINFKLWTVEFYKNDQLICDNIEIAKNLKYYPVISLNSISYNRDKPIEYQILS